MKQTLKILFLTFLFFGIYFVLDALYFQVLKKWLFGLMHQRGISHIITYSISGIPLYIGTFLICSKVSVIKSLGLNASLPQVFLFALLCTAPMFIGFVLVFPFTTEIDLDTILISVIAAGFFEEVFFRAFLFGMLFRFTKLGFIPSALVGAVYFGSIHLYQSTDLGELVGIFLITFLGALLFAWAYVEWNYNIWVAIFLHMLMNLSWELFNVSNTALGGWYPNALRILTIASIIFFTLWYKKRHHQPLKITRKTVWMKDL